MIGAQARLGRINLNGGLAGENVVVGLVRLRGPALDLCVGVAALLLSLFLLLALFAFETLGDAIIALIEGRYDLSFAYIGARGAGRQAGRRLVDGLLRVLAPGVVFHLGEDGAGAKLLPLHLVHAWLIFTAIASHAVPPHINLYFL